MARPGRGTWLFVAVVLAVIAAGSGAAVATLDPGVQPQAASCTASPRTVTTGEPVTLDASSSDADFVEFDKEGNGEYTEFDDTDFIVEVTYDTPGTYDAVARADGDSAGTDFCGTIDVEENNPPSAALTVSPTFAVTGQEVTFDASGSSDPDGSIEEYRWDLNGDGNSDRTTNTSTTDLRYTRATTYQVSVTVVDSGGATDTAVRDLVVREAPVAECTVEPTDAAPGDTVRIDATGSQNANLVDYDTDGDGEYDVFEQTEFTLDTPAPETSFTPRVRVYQDSPETADTADCGSVTVEEPNEPPQPALTLSPRPGVVGQQVTFDGSASTDPDGEIVEYRWDYDGDGNVENTTSEATTTYTFQQADLYIPVLTVVDDDNASRSIERDLNVREPRPELRCTVEPTQVEPGEEVVIDARESNNVAVVDYDVDGDGSFERLERANLATTVVYDEPGTYTPLVRVTAGDQFEECGRVTVEEPNEPPTAAFAVNRSTLLPGGTVAIDGSNSRDPDGRIVRYDWDLVGDGSIDVQNTTSIEQTYNNVRTYTIRLTVFDDDGATDSTSRDIVVEPPPETPDEPEGSIPWGPIGIGGGGLLGVGGLLYYFFGGGGGGGGAGQGPPKPKPKPTSGEEDRVRYETGVFALPTTSGTVSVPVGFEPDLVLLTVTNGARTDVAVDRTAGGSFGMAQPGGDGPRNQCLTVADDAQSTDQATCAVADRQALQLVRHSTSDAPGRVRGTVSSVDSSGFDLDVTIPGDDPLSGGVRVLYQAFSTTSNIDVEMGFFQTPTEPGIQTVSFDFDPDHVSLTASAAVSDTDQLWTTNCGVGLSVGNAVYDESVDQTVWGTSAWPQREASTAGVCRTDRVLYLLYQDADRIAGRTSASVTDLGSTMRLRYDRVYNGPQKLGSTARHPVSYLAMAGGEKMRPAVGAVSFPEADEFVSVDCGFEPAMVELYVSDAAIGEEAVGTEARPFDISHGTAIDTGDGLRQYLVHHSVVADPPAARSDVPAQGATGTGETAADGGERQEASETATRTAPAGGEVSGGDDIGDVPAGDAVGDVPTAEVPSADPTAGTEPGERQTAPDPKATPDDGRAGLWLAQASDGTIVGRDELRVQQLTTSGFDLTVESVDTDRRSGSESRPTVVYRAWPAVDGERADESTDAGGDADGNGTGDGTDQAGADDATAESGTEGTTNGPNTTADAADTEHNA